MAEEARGSAPLELRPGTVVRISQVKGAFEKGYAPNWSAEDFRIARVVDEGKGRRQRTTYKLENRSGEPLAGSWYSEELLPITANRFMVERVLRRRPIKASSARGVEPNENPEYLVKWVGWPTKFNTWVPQSDLVRFSKQGLGARGDEQRSRVN